MVLRPASFLSAICISAWVGVSSLLAQNSDVIISEIVAVNRDSLLDSDDAGSDWLEVANKGVVSVDLDGWFLTDDPTFLSKWRIPTLVLAPGDHTVIFASGKDRSVPGEELHTNFGLSGDGEYLALVEPDGITVAYAHSPSYPRQREDIAYGLVEDAEVETFVTVGANARIQVPASGADGLDWTLPEYDDAAWSTGDTGIGYDTEFDGGGGVGGTNLALSGTASQSSTDFGGVASRAIDGDTNGVYGGGSITHTANESGAWWRVDLGDTYALDSIILWNRTDCCVERLSNFRVSVLDASMNSVTHSDHFTDDGGNPGSQDYEITLPPGTQGRHVEVRKLGADRSGNFYLSLAEVEVIEGVAGYGHLIATDLEAAMHDVNASVYLRLPFTVSDPAAQEFIDLSIRYDDGFIAYVNGEEIARRNAPAVPQWNSQAASGHPDAEAVVPEFIRVANNGRLRAGDNVLAIHGLNTSAGNGDFLILPTLEGRSVTGETLRYLTEPTPGAPNGGEILLGFVADTTFSVDRGFYDAPFDLEITSATPGAEIRYTLDGDEPTETNGTRYTAPISISTTTVVRAVAHLAGYGPTNVDTQTYIFLDDVIDSSVMNPTITQSAVYGPQMRAALTDLPSISLVSERTINGSTEVPASIEWIPPDGSATFQENLCAKHFGGAFTNFAKKNFRLYFRSEHGATKLRFPLFEGHERDIPAVEVFDQLELRSGSHDMNQRGFYMSNRFTDDTMLDMGNVNPHGRFVHLYANGTYWGQYHLRERWNADMLAQYLGGEKEDYEAINGNWNVGGWADPGTPYDGDGSAWTRIKSLRNNFVGVSPYLDVAHYVDFMLMFMFGNSEDEYRCVGPAGPGSGFKFFLNDADGFTRSVGNRTSMGQPGRSSGDGPGSIFSMLLAEGHPDYLTLLGDRVHHIFFNDGAMTRDNNIARLQQRCDEVERAFFAESARWGYRTPASWSAAKNDYIQNVLSSRTDTVISQYRGAGFYPTLEAPTFNRHGGLVPEGFIVLQEATIGDILYTVDGTDPRLPGGGVSPTSILLDGAGGTTLLDSGTTIRVLVPTDDSLGLTWKERTFNDGTWQSGTPGVGYERTAGYEGDIGTDVEADMYQIVGSVYMRQRFNVEDPSVFGALTLRMKYDDGFVAYLNGTKVAESNAPPTPTWNSIATASNPDDRAVTFERFDITDFLPLLRAGENVLAVHGMNRSTASSDLIFLPEIIGVEPSDGGGGVTIDGPVWIRSRVESGGSWSALNEALFYTDVPLRITELMYHPRDPDPASAFGDDDFEFIEMQNVGSTTLDLEGFRVRGAVEFDFTGAGIVLLPGEIVLLVKRLDAFVERYPFLGATIAGEYAGRLRNSGESVVLSGSLGEPILEFSYSDAWEPETDGLGRSLVIVNANGARDSWGEAASWTASAEIDGSPGFVDGGEPPVGGFQQPGDLNQDGALDISDAVNLLSRLFLGGGGELPCDGASISEGANGLLANLDGIGGVDLTDPVYLLNYLFLSGPPPALGENCVRIEGCPTACLP